MDWIVFDYAGVISHAPPDDAGTSLVTVVGVESAAFWPAYWRRRADYDRGAVAATAYWRDVFAQLGRPFSEELVGHLVALDLGAWQEINLETLDIVDTLATRGINLAMLSNMVPEMARWTERQDWADRFRYRLLSGDLGMVKPDAEIYHRTCEVLKARPGDILFIDDRADNIVAAEAVGMAGLLFTDAATLRDDLTRLLPADTEAVAR